MSSDFERALERAVHSFTNEVQVDPVAGLSELHETARRHQLRNRIVFAAASLVLVVGGTALFGLRQQTTAIEMDTSIANPVEHAADNLPVPDDTAAGTTEAVAERQDRSAPEPLTIDERDPRDENRQGESDGGGDDNKDEVTPELGERRRGAAADERQSDQRVDEGDDGAAGSGDPTEDEVMPSPEPSPRPSPTARASVEPTAPSETPRPSPTADQGPGATATPRPTTPRFKATPRATATVRLAPTVQATPSPRATATPRPTSTPRPATPTVTPTPTVTTTPTATSEPTATPRLPAIVRCTSEDSGPAVVVGWEFAEDADAAEQHVVYWGDEPIGRADPSAASFRAASGPFDPASDRFSIGLDGSMATERIECGTGANGLLPVEPASCRSVVDGDDVIVEWDAVAGDAADAYVFYSRTAADAVAFYRGPRAEAEERTWQGTVDEPESHVWMVKTRTTLSDGSRWFSDGRPCTGHTAATEVIAGDSMERPFDIGVGGLTHEATTILATTETNEGELTHGGDRGCGPESSGRSGELSMGGSVWYDWTSPSTVRGDVTIAIEADGWAAHVAVYERPSGDISPEALLDVVVGCATSSSATTIAAAPNTTYLVQVSGMSYASSTDPSSPPTVDNGPFALVIDQ